MSIPYHLQPNPLHPEPNDYYAQVVHRGTATLDDLLDRMTRSGSTLTRGEAHAFWIEFRLAMLETLEEGYTINTDLFQVRTSIRGRFQGSGDQFQPSRHQVLLHLRAGTHLKAFAQKISPRKTNRIIPKPSLTHVYDLYSDTRDQFITPNHTASLSGRLLKFDPQDPEQGLFLLPTNAQPPIPVTKVVEMRPSRLLFQWPETVPANTYTLAVRAKMRDSIDLREGRLSTILTSNG